MLTRLYQYTPKCQASGPITVVAVCFVVTCSCIYGEVHVRLWRRVHNYTVLCCAYSVDSTQKHKSAFSLRGLSSIMNEHRNSVCSCCLSLSLDILRHTHTQLHLSLALSLTHSHTLTFLTHTYRHTHTQKHTHTHTHFYFRPKHTVLCLTSEAG